ncbi:hypothetical protein PVMG_04513 [Plasmodium vivax Mauritania I]|uniref:VIR protein n=1 Tax=Plasmodium vivax Mauritania I TaxID=1035515 RepID=A0A0J9VQP2_PLAVI|nr:hypothetical protein PVMG_04513 [Plasmodium vivax Mauritania I]
MFEEYNHNINDYEHSVYTTCDFIRVPGVKNASIYNEFCAKLMRNIMLIDDLSNEDITEVETSDANVPKAEESSGVPNKDVHCSYLNKWIYYYIYKKPVPNDFIKKIFEITHKMLSANNSSYKCKYESLNEDYIEPYNIIKLTFIADYTETILDILNKDKHPDYSACLKYIHECAAIYKKINKTNCPDNYDRRQSKLVNTCNELENFKSIYENKLSKVDQLREKLSKLDDELTEAEQRILLEQKEYNAAQNGFLSGSLQRNLSTGAVAAAGTGALLLALNKVNINSMYK